MKLCCALIANFDIDTGDDSDTLRDSIASDAPIAPYSSVFQLLQDASINNGPVAPWRFWCSSCSMMLLMLQLLHGGSGAPVSPCMVTQGLQYFPWSFWFLHGAYLLLFFMMLLVSQLLPDSFCFSICSMVLLGLQVLHSASGTQVLFSLCFWCSICSVVLLVLLLLHGTFCAPAL